MRLSVSGVAVIALVAGLFLPLSAAWSSGTTAAGMMRYGFIHTNVTCLTKPKQTRVKLVSQVFEFCPLEVPSRQIIEDNALFRAQVAKTVCDSEFDVTYESVPSDSSEDRIEADHKAALRSPDYSKHEQWHASVEYPTRKCR
jgi:hypothetical protein